MAALLLIALLHGAGSNGGSARIPIRTPATDGALDLRFQFTDASPHRVVVAATAKDMQQETEVAQTVEVASATAPLGIRVRPVLVFLLVVLAGLAAGRLSKRRGLPLPWTARRVKINPKEAS